MPIEFTCPEPDCGETLTVADSFARRKVRCPKCQTFIKVPSLHRRVTTLSPSERLSFHAACGALLLFFIVVLTVALIRCCAGPNRPREEAPAATSGAQEKPETSAAASKQREEPPATASAAEPKAKTSAGPTPPPPAHSATRSKGDMGPESAPAPPSEKPIAKPAKGEAPAPGPGISMAQCRKFLEDKIPENRRQAIKVLSEMKGPSVIPLLVRALKDPDPGVQREARAALKKRNVSPDAPAEGDQELAKQGKLPTPGVDTQPYAAMSPINALIHKGDYKEARAQGRLLSSKYPDEIKTKLANLDRIEALRKKCFDRVNSGAARVDMRRICPRYAFAGACKRADEDGLTAAITLPWDKFSKVEIAGFYGEAAEPNCGTDCIAIAAFLIEGGFGREEYELALSFLGKADKCGQDATAMREYVQGLSRRQEQFLKEQIHPDLAAALQEAAGRSKLLLVYFWTAQQDCLRMDKTFQSRAIQQTLSACYRWVKLDVRNFDNHFECCRAYGVEDVPHIIVFDAKAHRVASIKGYMKEEPFKVFLEGALLSARR
ncbi:MAG: hypothetical protein GXP25_04280 [Planctomycetes bacterium]|nr:hypothetical protein [Planctomycetota bacterium]